jgi:nitroreductase
MAEIGLFEAMRTTRAVRRLRPDPVPDDVLRRVIEAATWAPSGGNRQPWRIIAVRNADTKLRLRDLYKGPWERYVSGQRKAFAALPEDARARGERMLRAADHLAEHLHEAPVILVFVFNPTLLAITDLNLGRVIVGGATIYPAVENLLLACRAGARLRADRCCLAEAEFAPAGLPEPWAACAFMPIGSDRQATDRSRADLIAEMAYRPLGRAPVLICRIDAPR